MSGSSWKTLKRCGITPDQLNVNITGASRMSGCFQMFLGLFWCSEGVNLRFLMCAYLWGLPWWLSGKKKKSTCQCRRCRLDPWVGKIILWRRKWQLTPVFLPGRYHGQRSLAGYSVHGVAKELDMTTTTCPRTQDLWFRKMVPMSSNGGADRENRLRDSVGEGEEGMNWKSSIETHTLCYIHYIYYRV